MTTPNQPDVQRYVKAYVQARDRLRSLDEEYKTKAAPLKDLMDKIEGVLDTFLEATKQTSGKTDAGTFYYTHRVTATVNDGEAFMQHVISTNAFGLLNRSANANAVEDYVKTYNHLPPGVNLNRVRKVNVKRPKNGADNDD